MARVLTEGFEMGDTLVGSPSNATYVSADTTNPASGSYALRIGGSSLHFGTLAISINAVSEAYFRFRFRMSGVPSTGAPQIAQWLSGGTILGDVRLNTSNQLQVSVGGTVVATGTTILDLDTYYLIELHVKLADAGGAIDVKIDGISEITYSGDTKPGADTTLDIFWLAFRPSSSAYYAYFDDLAMNDTTGASDNSWCGDGRIILGALDGNGDVSQLAGSDGNSTDNYLLVDDIPSDGDTTYVSSETAGQYDLYGVGSITLPDGYTIGRVYVEARAREESAAGDSIQLGIKPSGGSEDWSGNLPQTTSYARYVGEEHTVNPADSGAWEAADIAALQAGVKVV